jgi:hypothetical protein
MFSTILRAASALGLATALSAQAHASFPPKTFKASKDDIAQRCEALGERASYTAWDYKPGEYGCVDLKTGFTLICKEADESCKLYFPARKPPPKTERAAFNRQIREFRIVASLESVQCAGAWSNQKVSGG